MSGVAFLFCCSAPKVQASAETESCPLAKKNHCGKSVGNKSQKNENAARLETFQNDNPTFDCCSFFPTIFDKTRKVEKDKQIADISVKPEVESPTRVFIKIETYDSAVYRPPIQDRGGTYLKNCVFRI